jgi:hypothetical protein
MNAIKENIIVDFDDMLSRMIRPFVEFEYGNPIKNVVKYMSILKKKGFNLTIFTARHWKEQSAIEKYLIDNNIPFDDVICGKPLGIRMIDDRAVNNWEDLFKDLGIV